MNEHAQLIWTFIKTESSKSQMNTYMKMGIYPITINKIEKLPLHELRRQLISVLYERRNDTVGNLAFDFNVSAHTIRHDIRALEFEYPIYTKVGAGGGVFILDSSRLQQRWLTVRQRELLMDVCSDLDTEKALLIKSIISGLSP